MRLLLAVLSDLSLFVRTALFGVLFEKNERQEGERMPLSMVVHEGDTSQLVFPPYETQVGQKTQEEQSDQVLNLQQGLQYFIGVIDTSVYIDPVVSFDTAIHTLAYGEMVLVSKFGGRWAHIETSDISGWILKDALREQASDVFPVLVEDNVYEASDAQTIKLRVCIKDTFGGNTIGEILTDVEYVTYALLKKNIKILWSEERPRTAGRWQRIMRGKKGVHIGVTPKTDTVMEYVVDDLGHVCYVEAVFSDETIKIRGIGVLAEGTFSVLTMSKEEWRELRPVFIEVV